MLWPHVVEGVPCSPFLTSDSCLSLESLLLHPLPPCLFILFLPSFSSSESLLLHSLLFSFILILSILLQLFEFYPLSVISHIDVTCISCFWCFVLIVSMLFSLFSLSLLLLFQSGISSKSLKYPQGSNCLLDVKDFASVHGAGVCELHHAGFCSLLIFCLMWASLCLLWVANLSWKIFLALLGWSAFSLFIPNIILVPKTKGYLFYCAFIP